MPEQEPLIIYPNRGHQYRFIGFVAVGLVVSLLIMFNLEEIQHPYIRLAALILAFFGILAFGYGLVYAAMRTAQNIELFYADADGLFFNANLFHNGLLQWDNIKEFGLVKYAGRKQVLIYLKDNEEFMGGLKGIGRRMAKANLKRFKTPVAIPASRVPGDIEDVLTRISKWGKD